MLIHGFESPRLFVVVVVVVSSCANNREDMKTRENPMPCSYKACSGEGSVKRGQVTGFYLSVSEQREQ